MFKRAFVLFAEHETERISHLKAIKAVLPSVVVVEPVFPSRTRVPFLERLITKSKERTGKALLPSEIGLIIGHRRIWRQIAKDNSNSHYLILESDSKIIRPELLLSENAEPFDVFFWGAWNGYMSLKKSTVNNGIGEPLIKSVYCTYGYSLNAKGAVYLLKHSNKVAYPIDLFKHYVNPKEIKLGGIVPEVISSWRTTHSLIRKESTVYLIKLKLIQLTFYCRNTIQSYFC
jgi:GR25 family glycosyltransferase involved in LPS biosynthesis